MERYNPVSIALHWLIALLIFGGSGRISSIMGDVAKGIKSFKKGLTEDEDAERPEPPKVIDHPSTTTAERDRDRSKLS